MEAKSYEVKDYAEDGRLYVVVTMDDDSTFGQYIDPGRQEEMDEQVLVAAQRLSGPVAPVKPALGFVRSLPQDLSKDTIKT